MVDSRQQIGGDPVMPNDLSSFWMPFTANASFKSDPRLIESAAGVHMQTPDGLRLLDSTAGLWCIMAGHARKEIADAVHRQIGRLDFAPAFQIGHAGPFRLAEELAALAPGELNHAFFTNSGSEAVDTAIKMAIAWHRLRGDGARRMIIGRERAYHGVNVGGISAAGIGANRRQFGSLMHGVDHLGHTHDLQSQAFSRGQPAMGAEKANDLLALIDLHGAENIAAVIVEPVAGATGVLVPPEGYLERLRDLCTENGILLIFDEVVTGFGRLGRAFAADYFGVEPDMITLAKGITNGTVPMGAVLAASSIYETFVDGSSDSVEFFHGYTYSGHPVACAAALAALDIYRREDLFARASRLAPHFEQSIHRFDRHQGIADVRNIGLMGAVQFDPPVSGGKSLAAVIQATCYERGLFTRAVGDSLVFSPPLTINQDQIDEIFDTIESVISET